MNVEHLTVPSNRVGYYVFTIYSEDKGEDTEHVVFDATADQMKAFYKELGRTLGEEDNG